MPQYSPLPNDSLNQVNTNLGGVQFGIDGEGNRCYLGADGSLIPFKSGYDYICLIHYFAPDSSSSSIHGRYSIYGTNFVDNNVITSWRWTSTTTKYVDNDFLTISANDHTL